MKTTIDHPYLTELRLTLDRVRNDPERQQFAERLAVEINLYEYGLRRLREDAQAEVPAADLTLARERARARRIFEIKRRLLLHQLSLKFGELPAELPARLATATPYQLSLWLARAGVAPTLEAIFG